MSHRDCWQQLGNPRTYYPKLAKVAGGIGAAIFLSYLQQQQAEGTEEGLTRTVQEIERDTGLSVKEQEFARKQLRDRALLEERLVTPSTSTLEFSPRWDVLAQKLAVFERLLDEGTSATAENVTIVAVTPREEFARERVQKGVLPDYQFQGPWESRQQLNAFQKALLDYAIALGKPEPSGWAFKIIDSLTKSILSPYWDEFIAGVPLGSTQQVQRDWEVEPGVPYPAFEEERVQYYVHKGEPLDAAVARARAELRNPKVAGDLWEGFLRRCDRWAEDALKAQKLGVKVPYLPPSFSEKTAVTSASVAQKLAALTPQPELPAASEPPPPVPTAIPALVTLQKLYRSPLGRAIAQRQIAEHPEWGYAIVDDRIVDLYPF